MARTDDIAAGLPAGGDGELSGLRRDIADELADHLACAVQREQLVGSHDPKAAWARVREKFGDPAAVARTLWREALWGRIMVQRILVGSSILTAVACCAALFVGWQSLTRQQQLMAAMQASSEIQLREQRELFTKLLKQAETTSADLAAQAKASAEAARKAQEGVAAAQPFSEWNPVEFRFVADNKNGPPLPGVKVQLLRNSNSDIPNPEGISDTQGIVRFPRVRFGRYSLQLTAPNEETLSESISVHPGEGLTRVIVCPGPSHEFSKVRVKVELPENLQSSSIWAGFRPSSLRHRLASGNWRTPHRRGQSNGPDVLFDPTGKPYAGEIHMNQFFTAKLSGKPSLLPRNYTIFQERSEAFASLEGDYFLEDVGLLVDRGPDADVPDGRRFHCIFLTAEDWGYRVEPGNPGTLWLTPTPEALESIPLRLEQIAHLEVQQKEHEAKMAAKRAAEGKPSKAP